MTPEERIAQLEAALALERAKVDELTAALIAVTYSLAGTPRPDGGYYQRRVRPKPGALEWAAHHPGVPMPEGVERRRAELQRAERQPLRVLATIEGTMSDEAALHARFGAHRLHGEWFSPAPELLSHIAALNGVKA